jgi:hypothetical protein
MARPNGTRDVGSKWKVLDYSVVMAHTNGWSKGVLSSIFMTGTQN